MRKILLIAVTMTLSACAASYTPGVVMGAYGPVSSRIIDYTPNFILKIVSPNAYETKVAEKKCHQYLTNRSIKVDGIAGHYEYTTNDNGDFYCYQVGEELLLPYKAPARYAPHRQDVLPLLN